MSELQIVRQEIKDLQLHYENALSDFNADYDALKHKSASLRCDSIKHQIKFLRRKEAVLLSLLSSV